MEIKMVKLLLALALSLTMSWASTKNAKEPTHKDPVAHVLKHYVKDGAVDYQGLKKSEHLVDEAIAALAMVRASRLKGNGKKAFWINAYNIFTLKLMLEYYPLKSIKDIPKSKRWTAKRWVVNGQSHSLDSIEHKILRPMGDPRIHFAIVCASISCPDLISEKYVSHQLDEQLDRVKTRFFSQPKGLKISEEKSFFGGTKKVLYISKILNWFVEDFEQDGAKVIDYIRNHGPKNVQDFIKSAGNDLKIKSLDYDWNINGK